MLMGRRDGKTQLARPINKWEDYTVYRVTGWENMDWIDLVQDKDRWKAPVNTEIHLRLA
jgi:hypothetical protein